MEQQTLHIMEKLKFSVTLPTMWRSVETEPMLHKYSECEQVEEIILIDNAPELNKQLPDIPKLIHIRETHNTGAVPPLTKGAKMAKTDNVILSSDDIYFDIDFYCKVLTLINEQTPLNELGYIGSHSRNYEITEPEDITMQAFDSRTNTTGWGCLIYCHKEQFVEHPSKLKVWYYDNFLQMFYPNKMFELKGFPIRTKMSETANSGDFQALIDKDTQEWHRILREKTW
jgi:hypothetical protein